METASPSHAEGGLQEGGGEGTDGAGNGAAGKGYCLEMICRDWQQQEFLGEPLESIDAFINNSLLKAITNHDLLSF